MAETDSCSGEMGDGYARAIGIGFTIVLFLSLLCGVGFLIDWALGTIPLFLLVGLGAGFAGGLYYVYLAVKKLGGG